MDKGQNSAGILLRKEEHVWSQHPLFKHLQVFINFYITELVQIPTAPSSLAMLTFAILLNFSIL